MISVKSVKFAALLCQRGSALVRVRPHCQPAIAFEIVSVREFPQDVAGEIIFNLPMSWDWLTDFGFRILIPIVTASVAQQYTTTRFEFSD
jgi:hypothetical protein